MDSSATVSIQFAALARISSGDHGEACCFKSSSYTGGRAMVTAIDRKPRAISAKLLTSCVSAGLKSRFESRSSLSMRRTSTLTRSCMETAQFRPGEVARLPLPWQESRGRKVLKDLEASEYLPCSLQSPGVSVVLDDGGEKNNGGVSANPGPA